MNVEIAVFSYTAICIALLISTAVLIPMRHFSNLALTKRNNKILRLVEQRVIALKDGNEISQDQIIAEMSEKRLSSLSELIAFTRSIESLRQEYSAEDVNRYCMNLMSVFDALSDKQMKKTVLYRTYFIYSLGMIYKDAGKVSKKINDFLIINIRTNSVYCRQNVLATCYSFGDVDQVARLMRIFNRTYNDYSARLISDGLVEFEGDKKGLADALIESYADFKPYLQLSVLNFIRFTQGGHNDMMLSILTDKDSNNEHIISAIRYFGKYQDERARTILESYLTPEQIELNPDAAAVSALSLATYPGGETFDILKSSLSSSDWYVRLNASISLERLGFDYQQMADVLSGDDRYAREIAYYRLEQYRQRQNQEIVLRGK